MNQLIPNYLLFATSLSTRFNVPIELVFLITITLLSMLMYIILKAFEPILSLIAPMLFLCFIILF